MKRWIRLESNGIWENSCSGSDFSFGYKQNLTEEYNFYEGSLNEIYAASVSNNLLHDCSHWDVLLVRTV